MKVFGFLTACIVSFFAIGSQSASADQNVSCVQTQLLEAGIDVGVADGVLGRKTRSGIKTLTNEVDDLGQLGPISIANASVFCRAIGLARNSTVGWTSTDGFIRLTIGEATTTVSAARIRNIAREVEAFYKGELQVKVPQTIDIVVSTSVDEAARLSVEALKRQGSHSDVGKSFKEWCDGYGYCGMSFGGVVSISYSEVNGFPEKNIREVLAHEFGHEVQAQLVGSYRARGAERRIQARGPKWLTEALAIALGKRFRTPDGDISQQLKSLSAKRQYNSDRLKSFRSQTSTNEGEFHPYSSFAGLLITSRTSHRAIIDFWENTPRLGWEAAFVSAFGFSVDDFYDGFGNL